MLHAQMSRRLKLGADREHVAGAGHNVAIEKNAGAAIGGTDDNCRTALRTTVDFAGEVFASREMIVRPHGAGPSEWRHCKRIGLS